MANVEISLLKGGWVGGALVVEDLTGVDILKIGVPTTGVMTIPAGSVTVVTTSKTMSLDDVGVVNYCVATTTLTMTLPPATSTCVHAPFTIVNGASAGSMALIVLAGVTSDEMVGCGWASTDAPYQLTNTAATAKPGDAIRIVAGGSTTAIWFVAGLVGTWVSTT